MAITPNITTEQEIQVAALARTVGVSPEDLMGVMVAAFLAQSNDASAVLALAVVSENQELYDRLR